MILTENWRITILFRWTFSKSLCLTSTMNHRVIHNKPTQKRAEFQSNSITNISLHYATFLPFLKLSKRTLKNSFPKLVKYLQ